MDSGDNSKRRLITWVKRRKVAVGVGVWALVIVVLAMASPSVTIREQTYVADALTDLNEAAGDAAGLLAGGPYAYAVGGLTAGEPCKISMARDGEVYSRTVTVYPPEGDLAAAAEDLANRLKDRYPLEKAPADKGGVHYRGESRRFVDFDLMTRTNAITWQASTGCRPLGDPIGQLRDDYAAPPEGVSILAGLGVESPQWNYSEVACDSAAGADGVVTTVIGAGSLPHEASDDISGLAERVPDGADLLVAQPDLVAYRLADTYWSVSRVDRDITVNSTTDCSG